MKATQMNEELKQDGTKRPHEAFTEALGYVTTIQETPRYSKRIDEHGEFEIYCGDRWVASTYAGAVDELNRMADELRRLRALDRKPWTLTRNGVEICSGYGAFEHLLAIDRLLTESHNARELSDGRTKTNP